MRGASERDWACPLSFSSFSSSLSLPGKNTRQAQIEARSRKGAPSFRICVLRLEGSFLFRGLRQPLREVPCRSCRHRRLSPTWSQSTHRPLPASALSGLAWLCAFAWDGRPADPADSEPLASSSPFLDFFSFLSCRHGEDGGSKNLKWIKKNLGSTDQKNLKKDQKQI